MGQQTVALLYGRVDADAPEDEKDVLVQVQTVRGALESIGYAACDVPITLDLAEAAAKLRSLNPFLVFNLAETIDGKGSLIHVAPALLDSIGIPYTGAPAEAIYLTSHKLLAKRVFTWGGIDTPAWTSAAAAFESGPSFPPPFIVKSIWEHASIGMEDSAVAFSTDDLAAEILRRSAREPMDHLFVERYVEGREFNLALLGGLDGGWLESGGPARRVPLGLPPAEIRFVDYPEGKPQFVGYRAKWDEGSFEYSRTPRSFDFPPGDAALLSTLRRLSLACWELYGLRGYARVDFRVDADGMPWALEVNTNPCLSPDAGFMAAAGQAGLSRDDVIRRIVKDSCTNAAAGPRHEPVRIKEPDTWAPR